MPFEVRVPRLGWSMESGVFLGWLKQDGDAVKAGDALYELEGEKATQEIEAVDAGVLHIPADAPRPGSEVAVGALLAYILAEGESLPQPVTAPATDAIVSQPAKLGEPPAASPAVRRMARQLRVPLDSMVGSGPSGRITAADVRSAVNATPATAAFDTKASSSKASPRARRVARELGIEWQQVVGSGAEGRVRERDVRAAAASGPRATVRTEGSLNETRMPLSPRRRTISQRMLASQQQTAPVTLTTQADATHLVALREQFKTAGQQEVIPTYTDIVMKLAAVVLRRHPQLASRWDGDHIVTPGHNGMNLGFAVDTDDGLLVPVVHDVTALSLPQLAKTTQALVARARAAQLAASDLQGGVFTITNLGAFGIDAFTPIINFPETAILGLGAISRQPVVLEDGQFAARSRLTLSLTFDHRVIDGAPAARFLQTMRQAIENPSAWLLSEA